LNGLVEHSDVKRLDLFECEVRPHHTKNTEHIIHDVILNVGGSIWALDWCPLLTTELG
jgi:hypothetical protein